MDRCFQLSEAAFIQFRGYIFTSSGSYTTAVSYVHTGWNMPFWVFLNKNEDGDILAQLFREYGEVKQVDPRSIH